MERQTKRLVGEVTQFFPLGAPGSFKRMLGGTLCERTQKVKVCSSAISTTGGPPLEIFAACASVSLPPAEAAQACNASSDGK